MTATPTEDAALLERTWHEQIPLTRALGLRIVEFESAELVTRAPLAPNINLHGTAFAGSLYAICALTGWGYVWRLGRRLGRSGDIVLVHGEIDYRRPVGGDIVCTAEANAPALEAFAAELGSDRPARCAVRCSVQYAGRDAVTFSGNYQMRPTDCTAKAR